MTEQEKRTKEFLEKLTDLTNEYGIEVISEGGSHLLYDLKNHDYIGEFGMSLISAKYVKYND
ncbi:hypothetical protein IEN91_05100 [Bacillus velezensis]|uniref:hypothetical protein n=1 Tax=Bacillus velezensis TaxID=492670 RepID=UPI0018C6ACAC|nr:hypothetical protein [Bacillus velezensis]QPK89817.1 hypothetical protein IEN91_05100 [Bacillus velezensis]